MAEDASRSIGSLENSARVSLSTFVPPKTEAPMDDVIYDLVLCWNALPYAGI